MFRWVPGAWRSQLVVGALALTLLSAELAAQQAEPVQTPFLMLENGMHVGLIYRVSVDGSGSRLVTGSTDKSIRVWDLRSGRAVSRLHVPTGVGAVGAINAVALTPNGKSLLAASASFNSPADSVRGSIYLFDLEAERLVARIPELPANVTHLAVSPDGRFFAAVMGPWGYRLWSAKGKLVFDEHDIENPLEWLSFGPQGGFATVSRNGVLSTYSQQGDQVHRTASTQLSGSDVPYSVAYSPDGERIAVGYADVIRVDVLDATSLHVVRTLQPSGYKGTNIGAVAWSVEKDGDWLYAGGTAMDRSGSNVVVGWPQAEPGRQLSIAVSTDSITHLHAVQGGGVVFASSDPAWGHVTLDEAGSELSLRVAQRTRAHDFREQARRGFALSDDGAEVVIPVAGNSRGRPVFNLKRLDLTHTPRRGSAHRVAGLRGSTAVTRPWYGKNALQIGSKTVTLLPGERALSVDIDDGKQRILLGTDFYLRLFELDGSEVARARLTSPAWGVAIARNQDAAAVALGDGTIRWYALRAELPLAELAGFFLHGDQRRWVAWSADGFFAHSALGGESMVGYYQNGSTKALTGRWIGFEQVYRLLHKPEAVSSLLERSDTWAQVASRQRVEDVLSQLTLPAVELVSYCPLDRLPTGEARRGLVRVESKAKGARNEEGNDDEGCFPISADTRGFSGSADAESAFGSTLPPGTRAVLLRLRVSDHGSGIGSIDAFVNGRNVGRFTAGETVAGFGSATNGAQESARASASYERVLPVYPGENEVVVRAYNAADVFRATAPIFLSVPESRDDATDSVLYVLAVGINNYGGEINPLKLAVNDASDFAQTIKAVKPSSYHRVDIRTLFDEAATLDRIEQEFARLSQKVRPNDAALLYLAGHGVSDEAGDYYFVPVNLTQIDRVPIDSLSQQRLIELLSTLYARNVFVFLDTCYSGAFNLNPYGPGGLAHESGQYVLTASTKIQEALDGYNNKNGVFAHAVLQGLRGEEKRLTGATDALELGVLVRRRVPLLADEKGFSQSAVFKAAGGDLREFPIAER